MIKPEIRSTGHVRVKKMVFILYVLFVCLFVFVNDVSTRTCFVCGGVGAEGGEG